MKDMKQLHSDAERVSLVVRLPADLHHEMKVLSHHRDESMNRLIAEALVAFVKDAHKKKGKRS